MARHAGRFPDHAVARPGRGRPDWMELGVLLLLAAVSVWLIALNLWYAAHDHLVWTGIDGVYPVDQLQYLAWVRDAAHHVLVSDLFVNEGTPHDYLQPMIAVSGGLAAAGLAPWLALLIWKPIALLAIFLAIRSYCERLLPTRAQRNAALLLALFAASFNVLEDEWIPFQSWGYPFDVLSVAALLGALIVYDRARDRHSLSVAAPALGALTAWLHPWQGELLIVIVVGCEAWRAVTALRAGVRPSLRAVGVNLRLPLFLILGAALPLLYYAALGHFDPAWRTGQSASQRSWPFTTVILPLLPLIVVALPAYTRPARGFLGLTARIWPVAALLVWELNQTGLGAWSVYAWVGITVPLAVLAVESASAVGLLQLRHGRWVAGLLLAALIVPGTYTMLKRGQRMVVPHRDNQNLISRSENRALAYLASDRVAGSVLSPYPTGDVVPAETGRRTFVGDDRWSTAYTAHDATAWNLIHGFLRWSVARRFVHGTQASFVLAPCGSKNLTRVLGSLLIARRRFGCAAVYRVQ